ncbi:MAG TPA: hypothetical protein VFS42_09420 [Burkholderiaceae bacterium]|nr:hypothetical protein [Burkholderiaceae bacterium]
MLTIAPNAALSVRVDLDDSHELDSSSASPRNIRETTSAHDVVPFEATQDSVFEVSLSDHPSLPARRRAALFAAARVSVATLLGSAAQYAIYKTPTFQDQESDVPSTKAILAAAFVGGVVRQATVDYLEHFGPHITNTSPEKFSRFHDNAPSLSGRIANFILYPPNFYNAVWSSLSGIASGAFAQFSNSRTATDLLRCSLATSWAFEGASGYTFAMHDSSRSGAAIVQRPIAQNLFGLPNVSALASTVSNAITRGICSASTSLITKGFAKKKGELSLKLRTPVEGVGLINGALRGGLYFFQPQSSEALKHTLVEPVLKGASQAITASARWTGISRVTPAFQFNTSSGNARTNTLRSAPNIVATRARTAEEGRMTVPTAVTNVKRQSTRSSSQPYKSEHRQPHNPVAPGTTDIIAESALNQKIFNKHTSNATALTLSLPTN